MIKLVRRFSRVHLYVFLGFYLVFAGVTLWMLNEGSDSDRQGRWTAAATAGAVAGPFVGAIARQFQSCCWNASLGLFPYCAAVLGIGVLGQVVPFPFARFERAVRLTLWCLGLLGWFGGGFVSFLHALS